MKEEMKQAIEDWILQDERRVDKQSHVGLCLLVMQQNSILRHADPEIMKQSGWVREEEYRKAIDGLKKCMNDIHFPRSFAQATLIDLKELS